MFPFHSLSFSLPHYDSKLHIVVFIIILCLICIVLNRFFLKLFHFMFQKGHITLRYKPTRLIFLPLVIITFFYNHFKFFPRTLIWRQREKYSNEQFTYNFLSVSLFFSFLFFVYGLFWSFSFSKSAAFFFALLSFFSSFLFSFFLFASPSLLKCCILFPILSSAVSLIV